MSDHEHDWKHELIVDAERCTRCGDMRVTERSPAASDLVGRTVYSEGTLQRVNRALAAAGERKHT